MNTPTDPNEDTAETSVDDLTPEQLEALASEEREVMADDDDDL